VDYGHPLRFGTFITPDCAGLYLSFETNLRPERLHDAFPPRTLARLRALKARYDPDNVFRQNCPITPEAKEGATERHPAPRSVR
jgi:hypothetical protein